MKEIITALNAAYKECGYVQKKGKMEGVARYNYAKESDFIEAIRPALISNGLTISPQSIDQLSHSQYLNKSGTPTNRVVGVFTFQLCHTSGEYILVAALGEGVDTGDKASYKAATGALKYALRQTLLIETGDDPDEVTPEPRSVARETKPEISMEERTKNAVEFAKKLVDLFAMFKGGDAKAFVMENQKMYDACLKYPEAEQILMDGGLV